MTVERQIEEFAKIQAKLRTENEALEKAQKFLIAQIEKNAETIQDNLERIADIDNMFS